jgi:hypothetical protein
MNTDGNVNAGAVVLATAEVGVARRHPPAEPTATVATTRSEPLSDRSPESVK